jgi:hypothetical protein
MFLRAVTELFELFIRRSARHERALDLFTKRPNKRRYLDINDGHYRTNQTFMVELGFLGVHSDEDHQR